MAAQEIKQTDHAKKLCHCELFIIFIEGKSQDALCFISWSMSNYKIHDLSYQRTIMIYMNDLCVMKNIGIWVGNSRNCSVIPIFFEETSNIINLVINTTIVLTF